MDSKAVEDLLEASAGFHFSGFHLDDLKLRNSENEQPTTSTAESVHKQPFVLGVTDGAASGKTTVCDMIIEQLHDQHVVIVNQVQALSTTYGHFINSSNNCTFAMIWLLGACSPIEAQVDFHLMAKRLLQVANVEGLQVNEAIEEEES